MSVNRGKVPRLLFDRYFGAADALAGEALEIAGNVGDDTVAGGVDGVVTAQKGAFAGALGKADLADDDFAGTDLLAAGALDAKPLADAVASILGGTACFDV